jgi:hypothetical protein
LATGGSWRRSAATSFAVEAGKGLACTALSFVGTSLGPILVVGGSGGFEDFGLSTSFARDRRLSGFGGMGGGCSDCLPFLVALAWWLFRLAVRDNLDSVAVGRSKLGEPRADKTPLCPNES